MCFLQILMNIKYITREQKLEIDLTVMLWHMTRLISINLTSLTFPDLHKLQLLTHTHSVGGKRTTKLENYSFVIL